jgi:hypothetical protein
MDKTFPIRVETLFTAEWKHFSHCNPIGRLRPGIKRQLHWASPAIALGEYDKLCVLMGLNKFIIGATNSRESGSKGAIAVVTAA